MPEGGFPPGAGAELPGRERWDKPALSLGPAGQPGRHRSPGSGWAQPLGSACAAAEEEGPQNGDLGGFRWISGHFGHHPEGPSRPLSPRPPHPFPARGGRVSRRRAAIGCEAPPGGRRAAAARRAPFTALPARTRRAHSQKNFIHKSGGGGGGGRAAAGAARALRSCCPAALRETAPEPQEYSVGSGLLWC